MSNDREFNLTDKDFNVIRTLLGERAGIVLSDIKRDMVYSRLVKRLRKLQLDSFSSYCELLQAGDSDEITDFVNALTTNLTSFFRENHHFEYLSETVIPQLIKEKSNDRKLRIWSAGCSTGEEPYSIAMVIKESLPLAAGWDVKILATDLDTNVVEKASKGIYANERIDGIDKNRVKRWFKNGVDDNSDYVKVSPELQELIIFKQLNLLGPWPMSGQFDLIFCRNVVIYFDKPTQSILFDRYADHLIDSGHLFVGHSETLFKVTDRFKLLGNTIYRKVR